MTICIFRDTIVGLLRHSERWIFSHNYDCSEWFVDYDKRISVSKTGMIIGVEYNKMLPGVYNEDVTTTKLAKAPLPDDVMAEFRKRLTDITAKLLVAPLRNT